MILVVLAIEDTAVGVAALVQEEAGEFAICLVPGGLRQFDQPGLDDLMARRRRALAGAKRSRDQIGVLQRHVEQRPFTGGAVMGVRGFVQVTGVVELVAALQLEIPLRPRR